jgi:hypothetical protein
MASFIACGDGSSLERKPIGVPAGSVHKRFISGFADATKNPTASSQRKITR